MGPGGAAAEPPPGWFLRDEASGTLYKRGRLLGEGAFGRCYQVTEVTSGRRYAAKVIPRARLAAPGIGDRVERERELQRHLRHPHIVRLHGHFADRGHLYLLLELCSRGSLAAIVRTRGRLSEPEVRFYLRQLLSGLGYLHGHGLVHRDLKLSNFLVTERMRVKIADLGLARRAAPPGRRWGALCGTLSYLAPEVLDRRGHAVPSDIWALGCAVYTALTGHAPFEARRRPELFRRIRGARYPLPAQLSPRARALLARMLEPEPAERASLEGVRGHPFLTEGFTPRTLSPRACHSVPIFVGQEPLCRLLRGLRCWRGCGCVPVTSVTPGGGRAPPRRSRGRTSAEENFY